MLLSICTHYACHSKKPLATSPNAPAIEDDQEPKDFEFFQIPKTKDSINAINTDKK
nr:hypothetical protein [uncultured Capnocytophaga sp.]